MLLALAGVALLFLRTADRQFNWNLFSSALAAADGALLAAGVVLVLLSYVGRAVRWGLLMRPVRRQPRLWGLISATVIGFTAVVFFGRPGEFVRPWLIAARERVPLASQLAAWLLERILDLLLVLVLFGFALLQVDGRTARGPKMQTVLASGGAIALGLGITCVAVLIISALYTDVARRWSVWVLHLLPGRARTKLQSMASSFFDGMQSAGSAGNALALIALTVLEWMIIAGAIHCVLLAYGPTASFRVMDTLVFTGFVAFGSAVQVPGIGGGMQVAAVLVLTELFGLTLEAATGMALLVWILTWLTAVPFGVLLAFAEGLKWSQLRHAEHSAQTGSTGGAV